MSEKEANRLMLNGAVAKAFADLPKPPKLTTEQVCLERANERMNSVAIKFSALLKASVIRPDYNQCVEKLYPLIRQNFNDWSKDDLATLACMQMAMTATAALRDNGLI